MNAATPETLDVMSSTARGSGLPPWASDDIGNDPKTYTLRLGREAFRNLKLRFIFVPALDAPVLVFDDANAGRAAVLQSSIADQAQRYARTADQGKRVAIASRARRFHHTRVALAVGYTWPGNWPGYVCFDGEGL